MDSVNWTFVFAELLAINLILSLFVAVQISFQSLIVVGIIGGFLGVILNMNFDNINEYFKSQMEA